MFFSSTRTFWDLHNITLKTQEEYNWLKKFTGTWNTCNLIIYLSPFEPQKWNIFLRKPLMEHLYMYNLSMIFYQDLLFSCCQKTATAFEGGRIFVQDEMATYLQRLFTVI